ncbi:hypothetical protein HX89_07450 [Dermacoccus nishinomiyaensis]|uniref:Uncharacterized protein n=1 Tax=Dermacoccus nishinomiyaensis TaxID=1274 RepID=A0A075JFY0_9MICO|nr:hypothetical protein HX89_07450 [Dermacoccus nishinomiyaensis]
MTRDAAQVLHAPGVKPDLVEVFSGTRRRRLRAIALELMRRRPAGFSTQLQTQRVEDGRELVELHRGLVLLERADEAFGDISQFGQFDPAEAEAAPPRSHVLTQAHAPSIGTIVL